MTVQAETPQLPPYDPANDPYRAGTERWYAEMEAYANRTVPVPPDYDPQAARAAAEERQLAAGAQQDEAATARLLAAHTLSYADAQRGRAGEPYIPGKTLLGLLFESENLLEAMGAVGALGRLVTSGEVERRGRIPGFRTYHMTTDAARQRLGRQ